MSSLSALCWVKVAVSLLSAMLGWRRRCHCLCHAGVDDIVAIAAGVETLLSSSQYWGGLHCRLHCAGVDVVIIFAVLGRRHHCRCIQWR